MNLTLLITIGVPLFFVFAVIYSDRFREPTDLVIKTFIAGIVICFPAAELNNLIIPSYEYAYRAGLTEEILKFLVLYFYIMPKSAFNEPMDAIVYGVVVSLGFATFENISYVYLGGLETDSFSLAIMRAISAIPMHATCGIIMGYFFGLYAFTNSINFLIKSLIFPIAMGLPGLIAARQKKIFPLFFKVLIKWSSSPTEAPPVVIIILNLDTSFNNFFFI